MNSKTASNSQQWAAAGLVLGCVIFGLGSLIVRFVETGGYALAWWRLAIALPVFAALMRFLRQRFPRSRRACACALLAGVFLGLDLAFWHESVRSVGPGISTVLNSMQIFFLTAIGCMFYGERPSPLQLLSVVIAAIGVVLMSAAEWQNNAAYGVIIGLLSGAMLALSMTFIRQTHRYEATDLMPLMLLTCVGGLTALIVPALLQNSAFCPQSGRDVALIMIYGVVMQCMAWGLIAYCIPVLSLTLTGLLLLSEPLAALLIDRVLLHKNISTWQYLGIILTLSAIFLGSLKRQSASGSAA